MASTHFFTEKEESANILRQCHEIFKWGEKVPTTEVWQLLLIAYLCMPWPIPKVTQWKNVHLDTVTSK